MKCKKIFIIILIFGLVAMGQILVFAQHEGRTEELVRDGAIERLRQIWRGQRDFFDSTGFFYPGPGCPNNVCWQGEVLSSLGSVESSSYDLIYRLNQFSTCPQDLTVNTSPRGDVRFRCRRQGADPKDVWCFAYRCEHVSPAGCKQLWRLRIKPKNHSLFAEHDISLDCFDVGNTGVCATAPDTIFNHGACF
jgi:hypothetical protein